jgi:hypothetical protein
VVKGNCQQDTDYQEIKRPEFSIKITIDFRRKKRLVKFKKQIVFNKKSGADNFDINGLDGVSWNSQREARQIPKLSLVETIPHRKINTGLFMLKAA